MDRQSALEVRIRKELKDFTLNMEFSAGKGCLGILGAYFSKIYLEVKKRPIYIARDIQK